MKKRILIEFETGNEAFTDMEDVKIDVTIAVKKFFENDWDDTKIRDNDWNVVWKISELIVNK